jgi:hypothetical protein
VKVFFDPTRCFFPERESLFHLSEGRMMRKKTTVLVPHAYEMMDHFVVDDTFQDEGRDKSPV